MPALVTSPLCRSFGKRTLPPVLGWIPTTLAEMTMTVAFGLEAIAIYVLLRFATTR